MKILQISTYDRGGGAEKVALDLHYAYRAQGHDARLLVNYKKTDAPGVVAIDPYRCTTVWSPLCATLDHLVARQPAFSGQYRVRQWLRQVAMPQRWIDDHRGTEDFNYPYTAALLDDPDWQPDVIHAHNLHGGYFDLRSLAVLSRRVPFVWTLHDTWAFTGHCAYFMGCERWRSGCGNCPDLRRAPAVRRDNTAGNWKRKQTIYTKSRLAITTPSQWLMGYVDQSMVQPWQQRVIPNGVNLRVYQPGDKRQVRAKLGLSQTAFICMFIAHTASATNPYKDLTTVNQAVQMVRRLAGSHDVLFVCVGSSDQTTVEAHVHYTGYIGDPHQVALYYQAADVLLHAANAENFPCVVLEALACGMPVVATAVGGIPEQIADGVTGFLVPAQDSVAMAQRTFMLMEQSDLRQRMGQAAATHTQLYYSLDQQANVYAGWFEELQAEYQLEAAWHS